MNDGPTTGGRAARPSASNAAARVEADARLARLETHIGRTLSIGVKLSTGCLAVGLILALFTNAAQAEWLMLAGLVLLMATPVARVVATVIEYASNRDWPFFILTSLVLVELLVGVGAALILHRRL